MNSTMKYRWLKGAVGVLLATLGTLQARELTLVDNGRAVSAIVVEKSPEKPPEGTKPDPKVTHPYERYEALVLEPARDIQETLRKMSGAEVALIEEGQELPADIKTRIFVGRTAAARKAGVKFFSGCDLTPRPDAFSEEGYVLRSKGNDLYIVGNQDSLFAGTAYGCYAFLERLGCRWYFPGDWGEVIPKRATVVIEELNVESQPDFPVRSLHISGWTPTTPTEREEFHRWTLRVGLRPWTKFFGSLYIYPNANDGSLASLLPPKEYGQSRPDFYATRQDGTQPTNGAGMLCLSNPDVLTESIKNLKAAFAGERSIYWVGSTGAGFSPPDGSPYCYCQACQADGGNFEYPRYVHKPMSSELYFKFMAGLAAAVPGKYITTMAYAGREVPPQNITSFPPNLAVMYAPIACDVLHPVNHPKSWRRQEMGSILAQYRRMTPHVWVRDYNPGMLLGYFVPERMTENLTEDIPLYKRMDIKGLAPEGRKAVMQTWLSYYVMSKLLWDSKTDVDQLKTEFYSTFFGPAAVPVRAWWDMIAETLVQADIQAHEDWLINHIYTVDFTTRLHEHVRTAEAAAQEEPYRSRVAAFARIADHLEAYAAMYEAEKNMDYAAALKHAERMETDKAALAAIYSHFIATNSIANRIDFSSAGRMRGYQRLLELTDGKQGTLVAALPLESPFHRDPFNRGVLMEWYAPDHPDTDWETHNTFYLWDQQEKPLTEAGDDWDGYGWYRMKVEIPRNRAGKSMRLWLGGIINEGWVWVNGQYAGHKSHQLWWTSPHEFDINVSKLVKPGENLITVRVYNDADIGGLYRRGFLYVPAAK